MFTYCNLSTQHFLYFHEKSYTSVYNNLLSSNTYIHRHWLQLWVSFELCFHFLQHIFFVVAYNRNRYHVDAKECGTLRTDDQVCRNSETPFHIPGWKIIIRDMQRQSCSWGKLWRAWRGKWINLSLRMPGFMCIQKQSLYVTLMQEDFFLQPTCWSCLKIRSENNLRRYQIATLIYFLAVPGFHDKVLSTD